MVDVKQQQFNQSEYTIMIIKVTITYICNCCML